MSGMQKQLESLVGQNVILRLRHGTQVGNALEPSLNSSIATVIALGDDYVEIRETCYEITWEPPKVCTRLVKLDNIVDVEFNDEAEE